MDAAPQHYDVIIVGAGMVGATLACALAGAAGTANLRIAVLEAQALPDGAASASHDIDDIDLRVSAITHASQRIFTAVGAWPGMAARRMGAFREMHVWEEGDSTPGLTRHPAPYNAEIHFDSADIGENTLGHIIENRVIQGALLDRLRSFCNITLLCPARVASLAITGAAAQVGLDDGRQLTATLVVGADGAHSKVRQLAGITTWGWSYGQKGVVATVKTGLSHRETAWQRFLPRGPVAFLPLHDGRCSIVWSTTLEHADALMAMDEPLFLAALKQAFGDKLGNMSAITASHGSIAPSRAAFPLHLQHASAYTAPRLALIGDAAHTLHPLAGQGVNLGVLDAATLAEVILDAYDSDNDIGAHRVLRRYERWRKSDNLAMLAIMDGFKRLFSNDSPPLRWLRTRGLRLTHHLPPVKNLIMRQAMGLTGDLPKLARQVQGTLGASQR